MSFFHIEATVKNLKKSRARYNTVGTVYIVSSMLDFGSDKPLKVAVKAKSVKFAPRIAIKSPDLIP